MTQVVFNRDLSGHYGQFASGTACVITLRHTNDKNLHKFQEIFWIRKGLIVKPRHKTLQIQNGNGEVLGTMSEAFNATAYNIDWVKKALRLNGFKCIRGTNYEIQ